MKTSALVHRSIICCSLVSSAALAQQAPSAPPGPIRGPIPSAIASAQKVFISNAGADSGLFPNPFSGDTDRAYNQFYVALKAAGQFELVADPADAALVLELQLSAPTGPSQPNKQLGASDPVPMFRLVIYDRKTHYALWTLTESIDVALRQKTHDRNFDEALSNILFRFQQLTGKLPTPQS